MALDFFMLWKEWQPLYRVNFKVILNNSEITGRYRIDYNNSRSRLQENEVIKKFLNLSCCPVLFALNLSLRCSCREPHNWLESAGMFDGTWVSACCVSWSQQCGILLCLHRQSSPRYMLELSLIVLWSSTIKPTLDFLECYGHTEAHYASAALSKLNVYSPIWMIMRAG